MYHAHHCARHRAHAVVQGDGQDDPRLHWCLGREARSVLQPEAPEAGSSSEQGEPSKTPPMQGASKS